MTDDPTSVELRDNDGSQASRVPETPRDRRVAGRPTRRAVTEFFERRYGIHRSVFADHSFWEKGAGRIWAFAGDVDSPQRVETLGLPVLRVRQEHWKPTTVGAQRFGGAASENVIVLDPGAAATFYRGGDQVVAWDGDWGYLFVAHELAGREPVIGVGLYVRGELRSMVPKGRRRNMRKSGDGAAGATDSGSG